MKQREVDFQPLIFRTVTICPEPECRKEANRCPFHGPAVIRKARDERVATEVEQSSFHVGLAEHGETRF